MKKLLPLLLCILLAGCVSRAEKLNQLAVGMTKAEVIQVLGAPISTAANASGEVLRYHMATRDMLVYRGPRDGEYFVRLINGRVESFGKMGDFDSTKDPTINLVTKKQ